MAAYGYCRVSTAEQVINTSLAEQERKIRAIANYHDQSIVEVVRDLGVQGGVRFVDRPAGAPLFAKLSRGDFLIASNIDRLFRDAEDALETSRSMEEKGVLLIVGDVGIDPVSESGVGKLFYTILAAAAEFDRFRLRENLAEGRKAKRAMGGHVGGIAPFGYRTEGSGKSARLVEVDAEQVAIQYIRTQGAAGASSRKIAQSVLTHYGLKVSHVAVCRILKKESHA